MALNLGHNEGEANKSCGSRCLSVVILGHWPIAGPRPAVIASTPFCNPCAGLASRRSGTSSAAKAPTMADDTNTAAKGPEPADQTGQKPIEARVVGQFIKDLSFENPNIGKLITKSGEAPNIKLEVNVAAKRMQPELYESAIDFKAVASNTDGTIYDLELVYAGLFQLKNIPEQALEPFLLINCPTLIFPFLRRLVADITREGGFPPLMLDPIDFGQLFIRRKNELAAAAAAGKPN